ncbi:hypothetical protein NMY22_g17913 [Coprinellus aureogranulatus]|nr:hypothetical protein NMY22_g17913 [Coprinellus aureogranulatus]
MASPRRRLPLPLSRHTEVPVDAFVLGHHLRQIHEQNANANVRTPGCSPVPLHYDVLTRSLTEYSWPADERSGRKIPPNMLESLRRTHVFRGPCCLCPFLNQANHYEETFIGIVEGLHPDVDSSRELSGEYAAVCSRQRCGYFLRLELFYPLNNLKLEVFPKRRNQRDYQQLAHKFDLLGYANRFGLRQVVSYGATIVIDGRRYGPRFERLQMPQDEKDILMRKFEEGMAEAEFWSTFLQCPECKLVLLRQGMLISHKCRVVDENSLKRTHPYFTRFRSTNPRITRVAPRILPGVLLGDTPENRTMVSFHRERSATPTDILEEEEQE